MKRRIHFTFTFLTLLSLIAFIIGATMIARNALNDVTEHHLRQYISMVEQDTLDMTYEEIVDEYNQTVDDLRITFINADGVVLADTDADELDNHLNRTEIQNLNERVIRHSDTLNIDMMYLAQQLPSGDYLRVAIPSASVLQFLNDFIGLAILIGIIIIVFSIVISSVLIKQSLRPLEELKTILNDVNDGHYQDILTIQKYDEMNVLINEINKINAKISNQIKTLKNEKHKIDFLMNQMNQGICVLDEHKHILLINQTLKSIYSFNIDYNRNKDYRFLFRDESMQKAIEQSYQDKDDQQLVIEHNHHYYNVTISYSEQSWQQAPSVIIMFADITSLRQVENLKKDFFINASHELKSPLTSIIGSSELISEGMVEDNQTIIDLSKRIQHEAKRMNHLVMDMLKLSEIENQQVTKFETSVSVEQVLEDVINDLKLLKTTKNIEMIKDIDLESIMFPPEDLYQLFKNLIENALKYGKEDGHVWIKVFEEDRTIHIQVKDDGIGIPKQDQSRVFERFYRVDKARSRMTGGTGLGLSIVKHLVLNHGGKISLTSEEDEGTQIDIIIKK